ncbi:MAG: substrate-binding domain-containing protein [Alphaproteobacteria bacterium]|nr:substrate-binding domain-containing protein [Alphaproteobacteria bacterium]
MDPRRDFVVSNETSPAAYKALLDGKVDMIFAGPPSKKQTAQAAARRIRYTITPVAREAFVFLVNEQNPVKGLSVSQLRDIYSGRITDWKEVGGTPGNVIAFQRNEGSGSQTVMLNLVMRGTVMQKPVQAQEIDMMSRILFSVADYCNFGNAIGYSFRHYATPQS